VTATLADSGQDVHALCRRFSNLVGWPVKFAPVGSPRATELEQWLLAPSGCCWATELNDGHRRIGYLYLDLPEDSVADRTFLTVSGLTEVLAELLNKSAATARSVESQARDLSLLIDMSRSSPEDEGLAAMLGRLLRGGLQLTGFRGAGFFLLRPDGQRFELRAVQALERLAVPEPQRDAAHSPPDVDALGRGSVLLQRELAPAAARWLPEGYATGVCLPVRSGSGPLGTLWAFDRRRRMPTDRDFHVLESVAAQMAATLERAVLLQESAAQHRLQRHVQLASEGQARNPSAILPPDAGIEVAAHCTSRYELGGDLCELIPLERGRTLIAVGDASGDSVPAAMVMSGARGALRAVAQTSGPGDAPAPERMVDRLNRILHSTTLPHQFMSLVCGVLDTERRTFAYTNAGHPKPILVRGGRTEYLDSHGMLLGVIEDAPYQQSVLRLQPGDLLVLFSDGVTEAMSSRQKMFRSDGIVDAIAGCPHRSAGEVLQAVWSRLETHVRDGDEGDDRTLLVVKVR
jgi:sigma-B regulation protein RsbU (phosphoserine phosphatase)